MPVIDRHKADKAGDALSRASPIFALLVIVLMALIFVVLFKESLLSIRAFGFKFIYTSVWDPVAGSSGPCRLYGGRSYRR